MVDSTTQFNRFDQALFQWISIQFNWSNAVVIQQVQGFQFDWSNAVVIQQVKVFQFDRSNAIVMRQTQIFQFDHPIRLI